MGFQDRDYNRPDFQRGGQFGGGGFGGGGGIRFPTPGWGSMTTRLIIINVAVLFLDAITARAAAGPGLLTRWGAFSASEGVMGLQVWRFFTYMFLHAGLGHLFFNMLALFFFGPMIERHLGSRRFLGFYIASGLGGAALYLLVIGASLGVAAMGGDPMRVPFLLPDGPNTILVGASGCIFGVLLGCLRVAPNMTVLLMFIIPVPMKLLIGLILLFELWIVITAAPNAGGSIAHLGGAAVGWLLILRANVFNFMDRMPDGRSMRQSYERKKREQFNRQQQRQEQEVDRILKKIKDKGMGSLTEKERKTLKQASERD